MGLCFCAVAVYNYGGDYVGVIGVDTPDRYGKTVKIDVAVAPAAVYAAADNDDIAVVGIVDCCLNVIKISYPIATNDDCLRATGSYQKYKDKNELSHHSVPYLSSLLCVYCLSTTNYAQ